MSTSVASLVAAVAAALAIEQRVLSMPIRTTGATLDDHVVVLAQHLAPVGVDPPLAEPVRAVQLGVHDRGLPGGLPPSGVVLQLSGGGVRPLLRHARERPG